MPVDLSFFLCFSILLCPPCLPSMLSGLTLLLTWVGRLTHSFPALLSHSSWSLRPTLCDVAVFITTHSGRTRFLFVLWLLSWLECFYVSKCLIFSPPVIFYFSISNLIPLWSEKKVWMISALWNVEASPVFISIPHVLEKEVLFTARRTLYLCMRGQTCHLMCLWPGGPGRHILPTFPVSCAFLLSAFQNRFTNTQVKNGTLPGKFNLFFISGKDFYLKTSFTNYYHGSGQVSSVTTSNDGFHFLIPLPSTFLQM